VEGDTWHVSVLEASSHKAVVSADDVQSLVWVPHAPHRLVVAAAGIYGDALLAMWEKGTRWRSLYPVRRSSKEMFVLYGVSDDGRYIVYGHSPDIEKHEKAVDRRRRLRLPPASRARTTQRAP